MQTVAAFVAALILSGRATETDSNLLGLCMLFFLPSLLLLGWERQQDFALSVSIGVFAGLMQRDRLALGLAPHQWGGDCLCAAGGGRWSRWGRPRRHMASGWCCQ